MQYYFLVVSHIYNEFIVLAFNLLQVVFEISGSSIALGYIVLPLTSIGIARGSATLVYTVIDQV